jgi:hypothetical protein
VVYGREAAGAGGGVLVGRGVDVETKPGDDEQLEIRSKQNRIAVNISG